MPVEFDSISDYISDGTAIAKVLGFCVLIGSNGKRISYTRDESAEFIEQCADPDEVLQAAIIQNIVYKTKLLTFAPDGKIYNDILIDIVKTFIACVYPNASENPYILDNYETVADFLKEKNINSDSCESLEEYYIRQVKYLIRDYAGFYLSKIEQDINSDNYKKLNIKLAQAIKLDYDCDCDSLIDEISELSFKETVNKYRSLSQLKNKQ
ncbi:MAG: hypothetical protein EVG15_10890 [Candidatus Acididesulfobacter diazotrophicus]|uniref:Uncharacterized protein n=1 Tax=Candidatus Acididesulfobacter diazotrophicus TaxID=2597226 RepID=A0A519BJP6_9DELT|nr:MAG: hypothetical protein EVG15_10890 [Candidatus Acididesulfobacter diazotrophicus]